MNFGHMTVVSKPTHTSTGRLSQPECIKYQVHILTTVLLDSDVRGGMTHNLWIGRPLPLPTELSGLAPSKLVL